MQTGRNISQIKIGGSKMTLEQFFEAETPEVTAFVKNTIGADELRKLCISAVMDGALIVPQCTNETDLFSRRIEAAIREKALQIIYGSV